MLDRCSSELEAPSFLLQAPSFLLDRCSSELEAPSFLLEAPSFLLEVPTFLLDDCSSELKAPSFLLEAPSFLLDRCSSELEAPSFLLEVPSFLLQWSDSDRLETEFLERKRSPSQGNLREKPGFWSVTLDVCSLWLWLACLAGKTLT
ncbi:hypothetical protein H6F86_22240 [Phormidium sp. FACHB-592]|uniref:Uncharacterized protein n=1 Tax=Stenomitos frigidus AS-A4 TaxID=2933935 RepID=A0ABV0KFV0_9CYAN|nr:hypothetical protein [Phormidium sp. FACHB-592]MBD2076556.1 hypothetical protein [Phormidium sp. FACHB-592]